MALATALALTMTDRRVLIVTGAGASHELGRDQPVPLMGDWAAGMQTEIEAAAAGSSSLLGITSGVSSEEFEANLGNFLRWRQAMPLLDRYVTFGGNPINSLNGQVQEWHRLQKERIDAVVEALHRSLYASFGVGVIDEGKALRAFQSLDEWLGEGGARIFATTNYDLALEIGWRGRRVSDGFDDQRAYATPVFSGADLGDWTVRTMEDVAVVHLHGAVGWYRQLDGTVVRHPGDQAYNPSLGVPAFLPPDPDKNPMNDATVAGLWAELRRAINDASHVLVIGHSLNDAALVRALNDAPKGVPVAIARRSPGSVLASRIPGSVEVELEFGPNMAKPAWMDPWLAGGNAALQKRPRVIRSSQKSKLIG